MAMSNSDDELHLRTMEAHLAEEDPRSARRLEDCAARIGDGARYTDPPARSALVLVWIGMVATALVFVLASR